MRLLKLWSHLWRLANVCAWDHTPAVSLHSHHLKGHSESELELHKIQIVTIGSTNLGCDVTWETEFCTVMSNICGFSVQNFVQVTFLAPGILRWLKPVQISQCQLWTWPTECAWLNSCHSQFLLSQHGFNLFWHIWYRFIINISACSPLPLY